MDITLVYPRYKYHTFGGLEEPLGVLSLGAVLQAAGHNVHVFDLTFAEDLSILDDAVRRSRVVGFSSSTMLFGIARKVAAYCRNVNPDIVTIVGGPHATLATDEALRCGFDIAVIGEGEISIRELVAGIEKGDWEKSPGIAYLKDGKVMETPRPAMIHDLDEIPFPLRSPIDYKRYPFFGMATTRGCPFLCGFCKPLHTHIFGKRFRKRSVPNVLDEIEQLKRIDPRKSIQMKDDLFAMHTTEWFHEFRDGLRDRGLTVSYTCTSRVDTLKEAKLKLLKETGCTSIAFGVESGSQKILDFYKKGTTVKQIEEAFDLCRTYGMHTHAYLMLGAPIEDRNDLEQTYQLVKRIRPDSWLVFITTPFPGNDLYEYAAKRGIIKAKTYEEMDNALNSRDLVTPMALDHLIADDLREYRDKINRYMVRRILGSRLKGTLAHPRTYLGRLTTQPRAVFSFLGSVAGRYSK